MNDVAANSPLGLVAANAAQTSLVILSLFAKTAATNAFQYISSQLQRSIRRYTGIFPYLLSEKTVDLSLVFAFVLAASTRKSDLFWL